MSNEKKGIKESGELIDAVGKLVKSGKSVMADGKVDLKDLPVVINLAQDAGVISEGFKGLNEIDDEIKDLDLVEAQELLSKVFKALKGE